LILVLARAETAEAAEAGHDCFYALAAKNWSAIVVDKVVFCDASSREDWWTMQMSSKRRGGEERAEG